MGTLYLIDGHNPTLASSAIKDTYILTSGSRELRGSFPVNLPFDVPLNGATPTIVSDLVTQKYAGLLSMYPGYTHILYDEQLDGTGWDTTAIATFGTACTVGSRKTTKLIHAGGFPMHSLTTTLATTPTNYILRYELFTYQDNDTTTAPYQRFYAETTDTAAQVLVYVSFNGNFQLATNGVASAIGSADQGNSFQLRFQKTSTSPVWIGSWALIY